jgi:hypothetical protein
MAQPAIPDESPERESPRASAPAAESPEAPSGQPGAETSGSRTARWGKRIGTIGFLFFLVKGLLWLLIPALILAWQWVRSS